MPSIVNPQMAFGDDDGSSVSHVVSNLENGHLARNHVAFRVSFEIRFGHIGCGVLATTLVNSLLCTLARTESRMQCLVPIG